MGDVHHLEVGVEGREVQGDVGSQVLAHPRRQLVELGIAVVAPRDEQRGDLEPDVRLVAEVLERLQHGSEALALDHGIGCRLRDVGGA